MYREYLKWTHEEATKQEEDERDEAEEDDVNFSSGEGCAQAIVNDGRTLLVGEFREGAIEVSISADDFSNDNPETELLRGDLRHPLFDAMNEGIDYHVVAEMKNTEIIMNNSF